LLCNQVSPEISVCGVQGKFEIDSQGDDVHRLFQSSETIDITAPLRYTHWNIAIRGPYLDSHRYWTTTILRRSVRVPAMLSRISCRVFGQNPAFLLYSRISGDREVLRAGAAESQPHTRERLYRGNPERSIHSLPRLVRWPRGSRTSRGESREMSWTGCRTTPED